MAISRRAFLRGTAAFASGLTTRPGVTHAAAAPEDAVGPDVSTGVDAAARAAIAAGACPGIAVRIARHGRPLLSRSYGRANLETGTAVADGSVFRIGSLTKQFTAALVLQLAARGELAIDDAVAEHLPFFAAQPRFTIRELLHQTAGLHSDDQEVSCPAGSAGPKAQRSLAQEIAQQAMPFDFPPGTAWRYSNANYVALGAVVEAVSGQPFAAAAARMLFAPLGLHATSFDTSAAVVPRRAAGYSPVEGHAGAFAHAHFIEISDAGGAGAMRSTVADLCRWHDALFAGRLLDPRFVAMMTTPGRLRDGRVSGSRRASPDDASYGDVQYGMGLLIEPAPSGQRRVLHYGAINGFAGCLETFVDAGVTVAVLCNGDIGPAMPFRAIRRLVAQRLLPTLR